MAITAQQAAQQAQQQNMLYRMMCVRQGLNMWQSIYQATLSGTIPGQVINVPVRNVGLIKRLVIEITGSIAQSAGETLNRTPFGASNVLSNVTFTDLSNQTRINTTGWHLAFLATARAGLSFGSAFTNDAPYSMGSNYSVMTMPNAVTTVQTFRTFYEIPISYSDTDLRGAIYANVVNATMNLQFTINPLFVIPSAGTGGVQNAVYQSTTAATGTLSNVTVTVYQNYLDQLPVANDGKPMLPVYDIATNYLLNNTITTGIAANQDNTIPFANFRSFMSTFAVYSNPTLAAGTDISYWGLQSANYTNILKYDPFMSSLLTRQAVHDDYPAGVYYFNFRDKPLETVQYGNLQLLMNPTTAGASAQIAVGYEQLALSNVVTQAGSLYSN